MASCSFSPTDYESSIFDFENVISSASKSTFHPNTFINSDHTAEMETQTCSKPAASSSSSSSFVVSDTNFSTQVGNLLNKSLPVRCRQSEKKESTKRLKDSKHSTNVLKIWLHQHNRNPYPSKKEKTLLAIEANLSVAQISTWFANARRRLKKENKVTWNPRYRSNYIDTSKLCLPTSTDQQESHQCAMQNTNMIHVEERSPVGGASWIPYSIAEQNSPTSFNSYQLDDFTCRNSTFQEQSLVQSPDRLSNTFDTMHFYAENANPTNDSNRRCFALENTYNPLQMQCDQQRVQIDGHLHQCQCHTYSASYQAPCQTNAYLRNQQAFSLNRCLNDTSSTLSCRCNVTTYGLERETTAPVLRRHSYCSRPQHEPAYNRDRLNSAGVYESYGCKDVYSYQPTASENFRETNFIEPNSRLGDLPFNHPDASPVMCNLPTTTYL